MRKFFLLLPLVLAVAGMMQAQTTSHPVPRPPDAAPGLGPRVPSSAPPSAANQGAAENDQSPTFKVNVKLVSVFATVVDANGAPVTNLTKNQFSIFEDGIPQTISIFDRESGLPLSIVVALDTSLSTRKDLKLELESARRFAHAILRPQDAMSLYQFSEVVSEVVPFTSNLQRIDRAIDRIHVGAATALYDAVYLGSGALEPRQGRKVMVVITDGGDTVSQTNYAEALRAAQQSEAIVYSIIIVPIESSAGRDTGGEHALIQMSNDTGGKYFYAASLPQLDEAFQQISNELREQYLIGYYPSARLADSDFRRIEIKVDDQERPGLKVKHRTGYYTTKSH
jgi:Ca-activated chloride channel family protein